MRPEEVAKELAKALDVEELTIQIRQTDDKKASVIDAVRLYLGLDANQAAERVRQICQKYPEVAARITNHQFKGQGQRPTPVTDLATLHRILLLLPGGVATRCRRALPLLIRYLSVTLAFANLWETPSSSSSSQDKASPETLSGQHLYVMEAMGVFKIGRSNDVHRRERELSGHLGTHHIVEVFHGEGALEPHMHRILQPKRVGGEYFNVTLDEIKAALPEARKAVLQKPVRRRENSVGVRPSKRQRMDKSVAIEKRWAALEQSSAKLAAKEAALAKVQARLAKERAKLARERANLSEEQERLTCAQSGTG
jgi:hypothetical protein